MGITIYDDGKTKVEIDEVFNKLLKNFKPKDYILDDDDLDIVLNKVFQTIKENGIKPKKVKIAPNIPVLRSNHMVSF